MPLSLSFLGIHIIDCQLNIFLIKLILFLFCFKTISTEKKKLECRIPILSRRESIAVQKSRSQDSGNSCFPLWSMAQVWRRISGHFWDSGKVVVKLFPECHRINPRLLLVQAIVIFLWNCLPYFLSDTVMIHYFFALILEFLNNCGKVILTYFCHSE